MLPFSPFIIPDGNVLRSPCPASTTQVCASGRSYWCYLGYTRRRILIPTVVFGVSTVGAGSQTAEVAIASGPAPTGSAVTLTKVWAYGTLDSLTVGTGVKGNSEVNSIPCQAGTHLYAGFRTAMGTTQPTVHVLQRDWGRGFLLQEAGASALTSVSTYNPTPVTFANNTSPDIRAYFTFAP